MVNQYAGAPDRPSGSRHFDLARQLVARGHDVTIFAAGLSHGTGREERLAGRQLYRVDWFSGVRFVWLRTTPYHGNTVRRPINMLSFVAAFLVVQARFATPGTVIGSTVHPFAAFGAWLAARLRGAQFAFEIRDLWPQTLVDLGAMRVGSPGERGLRWIEAFLVKRASAVITVLPGMRDYLAGRKLPYDHVVYIPNGVDTAVFDVTDLVPAEIPESVARTLERIRRLQADSRVVYGYVGSFGYVNRVDVIIDAVRIAEERAPGRIGLVIVGDGPERAELEPLVAGSRAAFIAPPVPKRLIPHLLQTLDATVVHATATPVYRYGISFNKLFEYMALARPVAFACASAYDPVALAGAGVTVEPDDPERLARAMLEIADAGPEERSRMGAAGREYVIREHNMAHLGDVLSGIVDRPAGRGRTGHP